MTTRGALPTHFLAACNDDRGQCLCPRSQLRRQSGIAQSCRGVVMANRLHELPEPLSGKVALPSEAQSLLQRRIVLALVPGGRNQIPEDAILAGHDRGALGVVSSGQIINMCCPISKTQRQSL